MRKIMTAASLAVSIEKIVADVNVDGAPGMIYPNQDIVPLGVEHSSLSKNVEAVARKMGYTISPRPAPRRGDIHSQRSVFVREARRAGSVYQCWTAERGS